MNSAQAVRPLLMNEAAPSAPAGTSAIAVDSGKKKAPRKSWRERWDGWSPKGTLELSLHPSAIAGLLVVLIVLGLNASHFLHEPDVMLWGMTKGFLLATIASAALFYHLTEILQETTKEFSKALEKAVRWEFWLRVASQLALLASADMLVHKGWMGFVISFAIFFALLIVWDVVVWTHLPETSIPNTRMQILMKDAAALIGAILITMSLILWLRQIAKTCGTTDCTATPIDKIPDDAKELNALMMTGSALICLCALQTVYIAVTKWRDGGRTV
jgi:hypothetical protein